MLEKKAETIAKGRARLLWQDVGFRELTNNVKKATRDIYGHTMGFMLLVFDFETNEYIYGTNVKGEGADRLLKETYQDLQSGKATIEPVNGKG